MTEMTSFIFRYIPMIEFLKNKICENHLLLFLRDSYPDTPIMTKTKAF